MYGDALASDFATAFTKPLTACLYEPAGSGSGIGGAGTGGCPGVGSIGGSIGGPGVGGDGWSGVMGFGMSDTDAPLLNGGRNGRRPPIMLTVAGATRSVPRPLG